MMRKDGQCYLTGTCNGRKNGKLGALFKKVCPKTPEMPRTMHAKWPCDPKDKCAEFAKEWSGDGICDMETCGNCDGSYVGDVFDGGDCKSIETAIGDESAVGWLTHVTNQYNERYKLNGDSWGASFDNPDKQVCHFEEIDYKAFNRARAKSCDWDGVDSKFFKKISATRNNHCARECRKYQWCNYAWLDFNSESMMRKDGQCYLTGTCNGRKNGKLGALFKKVCPKTPEMPRTMHAKWPCDPKDKCAEFAKEWSGDGICDMETCGNCDGSYVGDVFDGNDCNSIETAIGDESAVGLACFDDDLTLRRLTGQSCASFSFGCGLPLQANHHIWLVREICPRSCGMCSDKETVQEEQVGDDGGCYNRCRATGASMNECASDCPMPGETVVEHDDSTETVVEHDDSTEEEVGRTNPWPCRDTNKVGHNRSMKPGQMCNTNWAHVTWWRARHEYCKNDKGNWGCQYGYKRVGWWNDYCCNKWESLNTNDCKCR